MAYGFIVFIIDALLSASALVCDTNVIAYILFVCSLFENFLIAIFSTIHFDLVCNQ